MTESSTISLDRLSPHIAKVTFSNPPARERQHAGRSAGRRIGCRGILRIELGRFRAYLGASATPRVWFSNLSGGAIPPLLKQNCVTGRSANSRWAGR